MNSSKRLGGVSASDTMLILVVPQGLPGRCYGGVGISPDATNPRSRSGYEMLRLVWFWLTLG